MKTFPELEQLKTSIDPATAERHRSEITAALAAVPARRPSPLAAWRRWVASVAVAGTALVPAAALASDNAVPGDALYPIKVRLEPLVRLLDGDVVAEHRVEEVETLDARDGDAALIDRLIDEARAALIGVDAPRLTDRLDAVVARRDARDEPADRPNSTDAPAERPGDGAPTDAATTTTEHRDEPGRDTTTTVTEDTTTTTITDRPPDDATTTTVAGRDGGDAPPADQPTGDATTTTTSDRGGDRP